MEGFLPKILIVGIGGAGNKIVNRLINLTLKGIDYMIVNTDKKALVDSNATYIIQIGNEITNGLGTGANEKIAYNAANESKDKFIGIFEEYDMSIIIGGLGGGTGSGVVGPISEFSKLMGVLTIIIMTLPFSFEGKKKYNRAMWGISQIISADAVITMKNDILLEIYESSISITEAFKSIDHIIITIVSGIVDMLLKNGLINLDFADLRTVLVNQGKVHIGIGLGEGEDRIEKALESAIKSNFFDSNILGAESLLINIVADESFEIQTATEIINKVNEFSQENTNIIWGITVDQEFENKVQIMIIASEFRGNNKIVHEDMESELGIPVFLKNSNEMRQI